MAASLSYGKRILKESLEKTRLTDIKLQRRLSPKNCARYWCNAGLDQDGFNTEFISSFIGCGVFATKRFESGDFLLEYVGERLTDAQANTRASDNNKFLFGYIFNGKKHWIDASQTVSRQCHLVNDAEEGSKLCNSRMKLLVFDGYPRLCLFATRNIAEGDELRYDYGDAPDKLFWRNQDVTENTDQYTDSDPFDVGSSVSDSDVGSSVSESDLGSYVSDSDVGSCSELSKYDQPSEVVEVPDTDQGESNTLLQVSNEDSNMSSKIPVVPSCTVEVMNTQYRGSIDETNVQKKQKLNACSKDMVQNDSLLHHMEEHTAEMYVCDTCGSKFTTQIILEDHIKTQHIEYQTTTPVFALHRPDHDSPSPERTTTTPVQIENSSEHVAVMEGTSSTPELIGSSVEHDDFAPERTSTRTIQKKERKWKPKPDRCCTFCKEIIKGGQLRRHIKRKHKEKIKDVLSLPNELANAHFDKLRKDGIHEYNKMLMANNEEPKMRERMPLNEDSLRLCSDCSGYFSNKYFFKHKCVVLKPTPLKPKLILSAKIQKIKEDQEFLSILNRFQDDTIGDICRTNETILMVGYRHFNLRRHEQGKEDEVRKVVMTEMRTLARLYLEFKEICGEKSVEEMLSRDHLEDLCEAVRELTKSDEQSEKHGLKLNVNAVLLRSIKALKGHYAETKQDEKKEELMHFKDAYDHRSKALYPKARQTCVKNSFEKARRPANLPDEMDLRKLKLFIDQDIKKIIQNFEIRDYTYLRTLTVSRLTLFNARRGEEASRMLLSEWEDAIKSTWLPDDQIEKIDDPAVKFLMGQYKLCYLQGKGKKFVPVLIPNDILPAINILVKERHTFGIAINNPYVFGTKERAGGSFSHCSGWHALKEICTKAGVLIPITATKMRHRLSTIYAGLDMSPADQKVFFDHMGHSREISKENYQCPLGIRTVQVMGKMLSSVDSEAVPLSDSETEIEVDNASYKPMIGSKERGRNGQPGHQEAVPLSDSETEIGVDNASYKPMIGSKERGRNGQPGHQVKWSSTDTESLRNHFEPWIFSKEDKNKGRLPSKEQILHFIAVCQPVSIKHLDVKEQYKKTRIKLFNERKTARLNVSAKLKKITCSK